MNPKCGQKLNKPAFVTGDVVTSEEIIPSQTKRLDEEENNDTQNEESLSET